MSNVLKEIYQSINDNKKEEAFFLLNKHPDLLDKRVILGQSWLHLASSKNNLEIVQFLVNKGLDINDTDRNGGVPLHSAAQNNAYDTAKWLLDNGANVDGVDLEQSTPLVSAIIKSDFEMVKLLIERGARLDLTFTKNKNNIKDVMSFANIYNNQEIIDYLKGQVK